jgi:hypothetical protein
MKIWNVFFLIMFFAIAFITCDNGLTSNGNTSQDPINNINDLATYLDTLPSNTAATPYVVAMEVTDLTGIADIIINSGKYVSLNLYDSTFTSIGNSTFSQCINLTSVTLPDSVINIGDEAFGYCHNLISITIPNSVTSFGSHVFVGCGLISVTVPSSVTDIGRLPFYADSNLTTINVDNSNTVYSSENGVLYNKNKTTLLQYPTGKTGAFIIPNSVINIGEYAFTNNQHITSVTIPNSVTSIGNSALNNCNNLITIEIANDNTAYSTEDGVLYNKDKSVLILYLPAKTNTSFVIPNSVTTIGSMSFYNGILTEITIPASVINFGGNAFSGSNSLISVTFEGAVTFSQYTFPSDLWSIYDGPGTYTTTNPGYNAIWTKQ